MSVGERDLDFDREALREKYRIERDKRLREDGEAQYLELKGRWAKFVDEDPYVEPGFTREPVAAEVDVAIIGGGFSGMLAAARLQERGITDIKIIEAGGDFGGTWYWNRYPGAQCDIDSYCYLPLLEELNFVPKEKYSFSDEIFEHSQRIGHAYGLYERTLFQTRVRAIEWDRASSRWQLRTNHDDRLRARFVVMALGSASRPKLPGIPGIDEFEGVAFHTSRWDYGYTGGNLHGGMSGLADQRVAIIGTGATGIQAIPRVAQYAQHLYVFQRTPSSVDLRRNAPTDPEWAASLPPGWQRERRENFGAIAIGHSVEKDLVDDSWTRIFRDVLTVPKTGRRYSNEEKAELLELGDFRKMEEIRRRVDETVMDSATAEALKPWYRQMCKRPTFNDEYLPAFNRENVTLVDVSASKGVERITSRGVVANGVEYEVDCIVYASGFEIATDFRRRVDMAIEGRDGVSLFDHWADGWKTLHGFSSRGFPNWFYIGVSQNAFSTNMTAMFDDQSQHIAYIVDETLRRGHATVEPAQDAQDAWVAEIVGMQAANRSFMESCTPGYYNNEGSPRSAVFGGYTKGINAFNQMLEDWRDAGDLKGMEFDRP